MTDRSGGLRHDEPLRRRGGVRLHYHEAGPAGGGAIWRHAGGDAARRRARRVGVEQLRPQPAACSRTASARS